MKPLRNIHPGWVAGIIALAVTLWLLTGQLGSNQATATKSEASEQQKPAEKKRVKVQVIHSQATKTTREAEVSSHTAPVRSVRLRAETSGRIARVVTRRGEQVDKGAVIVRLAVDDRDAQLRQARAVLEQRRLQYEAAQRLHKDDYMTEVDLAESRANLETAKAEVERIEKDIDHTVIRAPFAGILERRPVEVGDFVTVGDEIGYIIQQDPFIVRGNVSEDVVGYLEPGQPGRVKLINDETRQGRLRFIAAEADPETRSYPVELEVANPNGRLIAGASAKMHLPLEEVMAHELEPATLTLNEDGEFGIKSVDDNGRVQFHTADIIRNEGEKVWLASLPENLRLITVGQGFVNEGDIVEVVSDTEVSAAPGQP